MGIKGGQCKRLTSPLPVIQFPRKYGSLDISERFESPLHVTGLALFFIHILPLLFSELLFLWMQTVVQ
jgi:hypothetical protein